MPFTLSHAVLAPPLARLSQNKLSLAALTIGCMLPDLYRLLHHDESGYTAHYWSSLLHPNLMIGLGFCLLWYLIYRPILYQFLNLDDPLPVHNVKTFCTFCVSIIGGLLIGNITHILWDGFTHVDFRTLFFHEILSQNIQILHVTYPLHFILQIATSIFSLPLLAWMIGRYIQLHPASQPRSSKLKTMIALILLLSLSMGILACWQYFSQISPTLIDQQHYYFIGRAFNVFSQAFLFISAIFSTLLLIFQQFFNFD